MMAEVEKLTSSVATDIPINSDADGEAASQADVGNNTLIEFGTSPTQVSSISHRTVSEYTASDLEGGEEYDDDEEDDLDDEDDLTDEDDVDDDDDDDDDDDEDIDEERSEQPISIGEKVLESEVQKKVDEDRSNPQYIPKRGTFYEHDDRMADDDIGGVLAIGDPIGVEGIGANTVGNAKISAQSPSISHASKTMKKWQPASGVERWSHDRFDESEQQPKSRSELISAYGYDIRTEDAPPRARRRRRYARGPTKYSRKWEDESAYIKMNNKERKPPRPSDFPALNERPAHKRRETRDTRELNVEDLARDEKENRPERRRAPLNKSSVNERLNIAAGRINISNEEPDRDREDLRARISGRPKVGSGRQPAMEFKPKARNNKNQNHNQQHQPTNYPNNSRSDDRTYERQTHRANHQYQQSPNQNNSITEQYQQQKISVKGTQTTATNTKQQQQQQQQQQHQQQYHGDGYSNNNQGSKYNEHTSYSPQQQQLKQQQMQLGAQQQQQSNIAHLRQPTMTMTKSAPQPSTLSQRLHQVQHRNDPSHVGSVQMHALATQNQQHLIGQQQNANAMLISAVAQQQQHQQLVPSQPQEQRGPKRYSSMRRSQHDGQQQHLSETSHSHQQQQQTMQQLHMQQPPPPNAQQGPPGPLIMQDQHTILQANLLQQLYHQDHQNLQAQMQALQVSQPAPPAQKSKPPNNQYGAVPAAAGPTTQSQAYGANPSNTAYYVTDAYGAAGPQNPPPTQTPPYAPQQPAYLAPTAPYSNPPPPATQSALQSGPPSGVYGPPAGTGPPTGQNSNQNYSNYQNYNTVGGTTYFVPPAPTTSRPVVLSQRRPTNAIPILPPAEKNKQRGNDSSKDDITKSLSNSNSNGTAAAAPPVGSAENFDHIIDNMFVQRPVFQPPPQANPSNASNAVSPSSAPPSARQSSSPSISDAVSAVSNNAIANDGQTSKSPSSDEVNVAISTNLASPADTSNANSNTASNDESTPSTNVASTPENSSNNNSATAQE